MKFLTDKEWEALKQDSHIHLALLPERCEQIEARTLDTLVWDMLSGVISHAAQFPNQVPAADFMGRDAFVDHISTHRGDTARLVGLSNFTTEHVQVSPDGFKVDMRLSHGLMSVVQRVTIEGCLQDPHARDEPEGEWVEWVETLSSDDTVEEDPYEFDPI